MLSWNSKHVQHVKIYLACNFKVNLITHLEFIALFSSNFKNVNTLHPLFQKLQEIDVDWNWKHVQLVKIYMPCNFEVNLITHLGVISLFSSFFSSPDPKGQVRYCHHLASVVRPLTFSYFNLLLWNNLAKWNQTWQ